MMERRKAFTLTAVLVLLCSLLSFYAGSNGMLPQLSRLMNTAASSTQTGASAAGVDMKQLQQVQQKIQQEALKEVSSEALTEGALRGMVAATGDKYSMYFNAQEFKRFNEHFDSTLSGIGVYVEIAQKTGLVSVAAPIKGSPGEKAGLRAGDAILAVDDKDIQGMSIDEAVNLIRGPKGTKVKLTVKREGAAEYLTFVITRDVVDVSRVESKMVDAQAGVGYIQITEFNERVTEHVSKAINDLKSQGMTRLILDLRGNPGGLLDEAVGVSSLFVPGKQPVVFIEPRNGKRTDLPSNGKSTFDQPLVVLVDGGSASAAEIVSGAIKDLKLGVLMGIKTFGKGSVQSIIKLPNGAGMKLTTAQYLTAGGISIHEKGIEPDIVLAENPKDVAPGDPGDAQLKAAIDHIKTMKR